MPGTLAGFVGFTVIEGLVVGVASGFVVIVKPGMTVVVLGFPVAVGVCEVVVGAACGLQPKNPIQVPIVPFCAV